MVCRVHFLWFWASLFLMLLLSHRQHSSSKTTIQFSSSGLRLHSNVLSNRSSQLLTAPVSSEAPASRLAANRLFSTNQGLETIGRTATDESRLDQRSSDILAHNDGSAQVGAGASRDKHLQPDTNDTKESNNVSKQQQQQQQQHPNSAVSVASSRSLEAGGNITRSSISNGSSTTMGAADESNGRLASQSNTSAVGVVGNSTASSNSSICTNTSVHSELTAYTNAVLLPVQTAAARAQKDSAYMQKLQEAAKKPINIAVMTLLMFDFPTDTTKGCQVDGIPLDCRLQNGGTEVKCCQGVSCRQRPGGVGCGVAVFQGIIPVCEWLSV
jgi:hypothetical protein